MPSPPPKRVFLLPLTDGGAPHVRGTYIYLPPPSDPAYCIRFQIQGASSICRHGSLWVNVPAQGDDFRRDAYREYALTPDFHGCIEIDVPIYKAGAFSFYTTYTPLPEFASHDVACPPPTQTPTYYIDVCPKLGLQGEPLPIDSLVVFSVLSKFMGSYPADWDRHLRGVSQRGYNMVHFTPLMLRGKSNSPYSIYDQHRFDNAVFKNGEKDVARLVQKMETEYGLLAMTDVVWNHTANNSQWLEAHPEAGYNVDTAPWLRAPLDLDTALIQFSKDLRKLRLPTCVRTDDDLAKIMAGCREHVLGDCKLWEYYVCDSERDADLIAKAWTAGQSKFPEDGFGEGRVQGIDDVKNWSLKRKADWMVDYALQGGECLGERFRRRMDAIVGAALLSALYGRYDSRSPSGCTASYSEARSTMALILDECNLQWYREYDADAAVMIQQLFDRIRYCRLADHGPKLGEITDDCPLTEPYFTRLPLNDVTKKHNPEALALANNGWVWAADAMRDNAGPKSRAYLRREVIVWDDCVKLRYGDGPEDNPYLWEHMAKYTRLMAKYFHGFRIDNCHSTPIHVAEHMLEQARRVNPNLFIAAELFTGSEEMDFKFCMRLGITVLVREAMQAWSTQELSRLVHRHGGIPIGSFETDEVLDADHEGPAKEVVHIIKRSPVHALFMDCTHDNEPPAQKRNARDTLSSAALVAMCSCAAGSVMGFDEIYPKLIELVHETRLYWSSYSTDRPLEAKAGKGGIGGIKKLLNQIHTQMGKDEYTETFIHHDREYVTVHRVQPQTRKGYFLIAHTAFPGYGNGNGGFGPTSLPGTKARCIGSWTLEVDTSDATKRAVVHDTKLLRGLPAETKELQGVVVESTSDQTVITIPEEFPPGSIALFETWVPSAEHSDGIDQFVTSGARTAFSRVTLTGCNFLLYRCEPEERDHTSNESGMYNIPGHGPLVYAGLQGWWSVLHDIVNDNNLGHPLCQHLRDGQWALDYCLQRLEKAAQTERYSCLDGPARWLRQKFEAIRKLPSFLLPRYFALVIQTAYNAAVDRCIALMSENVRAGQPFLRKLSLVSAQMTGYMNSASLWPEKSCPSMAAGLPHFASDWARCWGRDICISARGLLMCTGRYDDAREHILAFASVLKHGLVPNLLNGGKLPRYNARDSIWWFLQNVQDYTEMVPGGVGLLQDTVKRRFLPYDDTWFPHTDDRAYSQTSSIEDVIQEALQRHASGIDFREHDAGPGLDRQMQSEGFNLKVWTDWETGFVFGGNQFNCGTWMDKMGESEKAGNKGAPGTPRDGAAVEITGLLYSCLRWVSKLRAQGHYRYEGVRCGDGPRTISFQDWAALIQDNFERCYFVPRNAKDDGEYDINTAIVHRRGIYKDLYRSGKEYEDYQLRPNFCIAMTVAPDLFDGERALFALALADQVLRGPQGIKTLDPADLNYRPNYVNGDDSADSHTAKGRNYHQGPEWLWPLGFFLRALVRFHVARSRSRPDAAAGRVETYQHVTRRLAACRAALDQSPWAGLTELTNQNGAFCADSCPSQAWSAACICDVFRDARDCERRLNAA